MRPNDPAESSVRLVRGRKARVFAITALALATQASLAQGQGAAGAGGTAASDAQPIVITGTRIKSLALSSTSPVSQVSAEQIGLLRANTVEDFSAKLPQLAGGVLSTAAGSGGRSKRSARSTGREVALLSRRQSRSGCGAGAGLTRRWMRSRRAIGSNAAGAVRLKEVSKTERRKAPDAGCATITILH